MNYIPSPSDLLEMGLTHFEGHAKELESKMPQMTPEQRAAFLRICRNIAAMDAKEAA